ncbi:2761_t:CDS:10 [Diversispora eburnea]|uniref:2761_t:CDS:1 n=1 Tax=Diversispora eburnea TaxID=1213867 RepID=A0A9N8V948_9GLOM|nr:2761_t:CDS:10 [Diversispora eburnea]
MGAHDGKKVTVTYFDDEIWLSVADAFKSHLPIRNLHWKSAKGTLRNINALDIEMKRFSPDSTEKQHMMPETLLENPYLNLYFVNCDDNDAYRTVVRQKIRDWINIVTSKRNQEWLIVYVTKQETFRNAARYFNMKGTVFDKIKADFSINKRERYVQLRLSDNDGEDYESWQELMTKVKEGILISFDQHVVQYEEDIRLFDSQRNMIGWNYCRFFILKEGLALTFEAMNLYEEALVQYEELEASFSQVLKDRALAWFGSFGATDFEDDSANILDIKKKNYRDLIMQNTIPEFDFRSYLFARQCQLLGRLQRPVDICRRAQLFISTFGRAIKEQQTIVGEHFLESWIYSSCMSVVNECEELFSFTSLDDQSLMAFNAAKGELLDLARKQLDKLGIYYKHLPPSLPFTTALSEVTHPTSPILENESKRNFTITNKELNEAIENTDYQKFDLLYLSITNRALKAYEGSTRVHSSYRLSGDVAALQFHRKNYESAAQLMEDLPWRYGEQGWTVIENKVKKRCKSLEKGEDIVRPFKPMFEVSVKAMVDDITDEDGPYLAVELTNLLPISYTFDELVVHLVNSQSEGIWFGIRDQELNPGSNEYKLYSDNSASGNYVAENIHMSMGKVVFMQNFLNENKKKSFRINEHPAVLRAQIIAPNEIHVGEQQYFIAQIFTGLTNVIKGTLTLDPLSEGLTFPQTDKYQAVVKIMDHGVISNEIDSEMELNVSENNQIQLPPLQPNKLIQFKVPYDFNWNSIEHKEQIKLTVIYDRKAKSRIFTAVNTVKICLFLKMDVTLNGYIPVRILDTSLVPSKVYDVVDSPPLASPIVTVNLLDTIFISVISIQFYYLTPRDHLIEVEKFVEYNLNKLLESKNLLQHSRYLLENAKEYLLKAVDYVTYGMTDVLDLGELNIVQFSGDLKSSISFPVDVPSSKVLNTVELVISKPNDLVVGEPCHCRLVIRHSSYWDYAFQTDNNNPFEFYYDVHVDFDNWLLAGHKKLCFTSKVGETKEFPITLVPLKTGFLLVPLIRIASPSPNVFSETVYLNNAEQVLVRPRTQSATFFIEQQHRIHSIHSGSGFGGPGHHHNDSGLDDINID